MGNKLEQLGMQTAGEAADSLIGAGMGLLLEKHNDKRQLRQQEKLQNLNIRGQQEMGLWNQQRQMEMWKATGPVGQVEQLEQAGLNPALIYGMGGAGGQSANIEGANIGGANAPTGGGEAMGLMMTKMQLGLMEAQRENIKADTANKNATTPNIQASTASLTQGIENQKAIEALTKIQTQIQEVQLEWTDKQLEANLEKTNYEIMLLWNEKEISDSTVKTKIKQIEQEYINAVLQADATKQAMKLSEAEIMKMAADIVLKSRELDIHQFTAEIKANMPTLSETGGAMLNSIKRQFDKMTGMPESYVRPNQVKH